jgi:hypothetical protein
MDTFWNNALKSQFLAAIDMLEKPILACPNELWKASLWNDPNTSAGFTEFWYVAYHTLFWLDLYLTGTDDGFAPPTPFDLNELEAGMMPAKNFSRSELLLYTAHCRQKCQATIETLTDEAAHRACEFPWSHGMISFAELLLDNMRHVQEHGAQLNLFLGQHAGLSARWVARKLDNLTGDAPAA